MLGRERIKPQGIQGRRLTGPSAGRITSQPDELGLPSFNPLLAPQLERCRRCPGIENKVERNLDGTRAHALGEPAHREPLGALEPEQGTRPHPACPPRLAEDAWSPGWEFATINPSSSTLSPTRASSCSRRDHLLIGAGIGPNDGCSDRHGHRSIASLPDKDIAEQRVQTFGCIVGLGGLRLGLDCRSMVSSQRLGFGQCDGSPVQNGKITGQQGRQIVGLALRVTEARWIIGIEASVAGATSMLRRTKAPPRVLRSSRRSSTFGRIERVSSIDREPELEPDQARDVGSADAHQVDRSDEEARGRGV